MTDPYPANRSHILTEQRNPRTMNLHRQSVAELVQTIQDEDKAITVALNQAADSLTQLIQAAEQGFCNGGRLIYYGAGTSGRLGVLDASEAPPTFMVPPDKVIGIIAGGDRALRKSSEGMEDDPRGVIPELEALNLNHLDTIIGIAAGGTTPYVCGAFEWIKQRDNPPLTGMLSCTPIEKPLGCDHLVVIQTGPEVLTGSTRMKAGTATKMALNTISTTLMIRAGRSYQNLMVDMSASNDKLKDRAARVLAELCNITREEAFTLLTSANGKVKTGLVMHHCNVSHEKAEALLAEHHGQLDKLLDG